MIANDEYVVLVDKNDNVLGTAAKLETHNSSTPLHRGFSVFLFNKNGKLLLQQRSAKKKTWPMIWSNSCCGHPLLNESSIDAAKRRLKFELGISDAEIFEIVKDFRYKVELDGIIENEICPVLVGNTNKEPIINRDEVENIAWISWNQFLRELKNNPTKYSQWSVLETRELLKNKKFQNFQKNHFTS